LKSPALIWSGPFVLISFHLQLTTETPWKKREKEEEKQRKRKRTQK